MSIYAHGHNISIRMLRICDSAILEPLQSFWTVVKIKVCLLISGKKCLVHKKHDKLSIIITSLWKNIWKSNFQFFI